MDGKRKRHAIKQGIAIVKRATGSARAVASCREGHWHGKLMPSSSTRSMLPCSHGLDFSRDIA